MKNPVYLVAALLALGVVAACGGVPPTAKPSPTDVPVAAPEPSGVPVPETQPSEEALPGPSPVMPSDMSGVEWQWVELLETESDTQWVVPDPGNYTLVFDSNGDVSITADCNLLVGSYTLKGDSFSTQVGPSTTAFCGDESLDELYLASLAAVESLAVRDGRLVLYLEDGAGQMEFYNAGLPEQPTGTESPSDLSGTVWRWLELVEIDPAGQSAVPDPQNYTLVFTNNGEVGVKADCNHVSGTYTLEGDSLRIGLGFSTLASCGDESLDQLYLAYLSSAGSATIQGDRLILRFEDGAGQMVFENGGPVEAAISGETLPDIVGGAWQWSELIETDPASPVLVVDPVSYTLVFSPDGEVGIRADCNQVHATYSIEGGALSIHFGQSTTVSCGEESRDQLFLVLLSQVETAELENGRLILHLADDAGQMVLEKGTEAALGAVGIHPSSVTLDTQGLPYSWQANLVPATPYDDTQPEGSRGLPPHIQINFGVADPAEEQPSNPIIYIIPTEAYELLWNGGEDPSVTIVLDDLETMLAEQTQIPSSGMPALPFEELGGVNDLAVLGEYSNLGIGSGVRFVGRFVQDPNPVTNDGLHYIFQGFSADGRYLIAFFYPVSTSALPFDKDVSAKELQSLESDLGAYLEERAGVLNALGDADWDPGLSTLDSVLASLTFQTVASGASITNVRWELQRFSGEGASELTVDDAGSYTVVLGPNGRLEFEADCNSGSGNYALEGSTLTLELEPGTTAFCGEDSLHDEYLRMLGNVGAYIIDDGGLVLIPKEEGGNMVFADGGPAP